MLKKISVTGITLSLLLGSINAQDTTKKAVVPPPPPPVSISGSVDAYYRYNFADAKGGVTNNLTSFTNSQNSFELGMATLKLDHTVGKVSATADLGFGRRAAEFSYNDAGSLASVKQLYLSYAVSSKVKLTMGKWATHVGFELVDAIANRNYSMSYGFSYGPFFHTGLKADISLGGKSALMVGFANPTDYSTTASSTKMLLAQFCTASKNDKFKAYLNYQGGSSTDASLTQFDLVLQGVLSSKFTINYDGTIQSRKFGSTTNSWSSNAVYLNFDPTSKFGLTLRGEYFDDTKSVVGVGTSIFIPTLSANFKVDNLTIIPEIRLDNAKDNVFVKSDGSATKSTSSFILAAVYKF
jgi:hypothetical protein